jgi:uncharacterized membrane protein YcjF (UPF0283 family)
VSTRLAAGTLIAVAVVCGLVGVTFALQVRGSSHLDPAYLGAVVAEAMVAVVFLVLAGCAVIGLVVLRGVAEMLNQALQAVAEMRSQTGPGAAADARAHARPTRSED